MVSEQPMLRIPAHATPHHSDPPDAHEFYAALGMVAIAWGRFEGHLMGTILQILNLPEASDNPQPPPIAWGRKAKFWKNAFKTFPSLAPLRNDAIAFMGRVMAEVEDRHFGAHAIWDEFVAGSPEPTARARTIKPRKGDDTIVDVTDYVISITILRKMLEIANNLNFEMCQFSSFLDSLRPLPPNVRTL